MENNSASAANTQGATDTSSTESATVENQTSEADDAITRDESNLSDDTSQALDENQVNDSGLSDEGLDTQDVEGESNEPQLKGADKRKAQLEARKAQAQEDIRRLNGEVRELESQRDQMAQYQDYQPMTGEQILNTINPETGDYYTPQEAQGILMMQEIQSMKMEREQERYVAKAAQSINSMISDVEKVRSDFPVFDPRSSEYDSVLSDQVLSIAEANMVRDASGNSIGTRVPIYKLYESFHNAHQSGSVVGETRKVQNTAKMQSRVDGIGGVAQKEPEFTNLSVKQMRQKLIQRGYDIK